MNRKTLDVIIPAYNSYDTIIKTLSSIALQETNFPIYVTIVNDHSKRSFSKEVKLFEEKLNISEIILKENSGVGIARQVGLENTNGDYIAFIDSDDLFYNCNSLQVLYDLIDYDNNDYGYGSIVMEEENGRNIYNEHEGCIHGKIFKRQFLIENNIRFNSTRTSEDNSFNHICLFNTNKKNTTNEIVYIYKFTSNSLTKGLDGEKYLDNLKDYIDNVIYTIKNVKNKNQIDVVLYYLNSYLYIRSNYLDFNKKNKEYGKKILNMLENMEKECGLDKEEIIDNILPRLDLNNL